jgi:hypothetical protein
MLLLIFLVFGAYKLYHFKKDSADGRLLIWKIGTQMILDRPLTGVGIGNFELQFQQNQTEWAKKGQLMPEELDHASYIKMAYNDYLELLIETGIIGLLLYVFVLICVFTLPFYYFLPKARDTLIFTTVYVGLMAGMVMAFMNFFIDAIPAYLVFSIYLAIIFGLNYQYKKISIPALFNSLSIKFRYTPLIALFVFLFTCYLAFKQLQIIYAERLHKIAYNKKKKGLYLEAQHILYPLQNTLKTHPDYWLDFASTELVLGNVHLSKQYLNEARKLTANPEVLRKQAQIFKAERDFTKAIEVYQYLTLAEPNRLYPKYELMNLYHQKRDTFHVIFYAQDIMNKQVKISNQKSKRYKRKATELLNYYQ